MRLAYYVALKTTIISPNYVIVSVSRITVHDLILINFKVVVWYVHLVSSSITSVMFVYKFCWNNFAVKFGFNFMANHPNENIWIQVAIHIRINYVHSHTISTTSLYKEIIYILTAALNQIILVKIIIPIFVTEINVCVLNFSIQCTTWSLIDSVSTSCCGITSSCELSATVVNHHQ